MFVPCLAKSEMHIEQVHLQPPSKVAEGADQEFLQNLSETDNALAANGKNWRSVAQALDSFDMFWCRAWQRQSFPTLEVGGFYLFLPRFI